MNYKRIGSGGTKVKGKKAAAILFTDGKSMLLLKRAGEGDYIGTWALPGGKSKDKETEIDNAIRETKEETGIDSIPGYRFASSTHKNGHQKFTIFLYKINNKFDVKLSKEHSDWGWIDFDNLKKIKLHPKFEKEIPELLKIIRKKTTASFDEWSKITDVIKLID